MSNAIRLTRDQLRRLAALLVVCQALFGGAALAQTTGTLAGTVYDEDGIEVPGVTVTISSPQLIGGAQSQQTDDYGRYRFVELMPGVYTIRAQHPNFSIVTIEGVQVQINRTVTEDITLRSGSVEEITVVSEGQQLIDTESTTIGTVLTKDFLSRIPTGRTYQDAVAVTAGVTGGTGGNPNMAGAAYNENTYMLDGMVMTDPVTGTFASNFNFDAIQQIEVLLGGYDAEYGVSLGGIINLVTESGTNNLEFDTSIYYENGNWYGRKDERYTADGYTLARTDFDSTFQSLTIAANVSGPLVQDKAWFIFSYQYNRSLIALSGVPQRRDFDGHYILGKLTIQPNSSHRISAQVQADPTTVDNIDQSTAFIKPEAQTRQAQSGFTSQLRWQWFMNEDMNLDTRVQVQKVSIEQYAVPCTHNRDADVHPCLPGEEEGTVDFETPGRIGSFGAFSSVNSGVHYFDDRWRFAAGTKFSIVGLTDPAGGTHDIKIGVETNQYVNNVVNGVSGNLNFIDVNVAGFDPETFSNYYWVEYSSPVMQRETGSTWSAFVQDAYKPFTNLTIRTGLRYDNVVLRNDVGEPVIRGGMVAPRLYASWDPFGDQKMKIAGGYGRFNDSGRQAFSGFTSRATFGYKMFLGEYFNAFDSNLGFLNASNLMYDAAPRVNTNVAHDHMTLPSVDEFNLHVQRQIVPDLAVGVVFMAKWTRSLYDADELNLIYDEDGSSIIGSRRADPLTNYLRLRTPRQNQRNYYSVAVDLTKRFAKRWGGQITYNYTYLTGTSNVSLAGSFDNDPQTRLAFGRLTNATEHQVRGYGYWNIPNDPWTTTLGFVVMYDSGAPLERFYYSDASGGYDLRVRNRGYYWHFNDIWWLGIRIRQEFDVRKGKLIADLNMQNITNNRAPESLDAVFYRENRLFTLGRQPPFSIQLGLVYEY